MTNKLYEHVTYVVQENTELTSKLQHAETEITNLKSANGRLEYWLLTLSEKLNDANNEIDRLGMILRHRAKEKEMPSARWTDKQSNSPHSALRQH